MRGRKPKPTKLKIITGNPGRRSLNTHEPKPGRAIGTCPNWLSAEAKKEWKRVLPELGRLGLATLVDRAALAAYCQAWAELQQATRDLRSRSPLLRKDALSRQKSAFTNLRAFSSEFGFTPSSRSRIQSGEGQGDDELEHFLNAPAS